MGMLELTLEDTLQQELADLLPEHGSGQAHASISTAPLEPFTRTRSPVFILWVASEVPTTAGMPNSRETTAGWETVPPASVTRPLTLVKRTTQAGFVIRQTSMSPSST